MTASRRRPIASSLSRKKVVSIRKYNHPVNAGVIMFVVMFIYVIINVVMYFSKEHISIYEVTIQGSITQEKDYTGVILREETVNTTEAAGYVNYYIREGERAAVGDTIYTLDESGRISEILFSDTNSSLKDADLTGLKKELTNFCLDFSPLKFDTIYGFKMDIDYQILELANVSNIANLDQLLQENAGGVFQRKTSSQTGSIAYYIDGMESLTPETITAEIFQTENYQKVIRKSSDLLEANSPVYKLVTSDKWSLVFPMTEKDLTNYGGKTSLTIHIIQDDFNIQGDFSVYTNANGTYGKLDFDRFMIRYISDRFLNFEIVEEVETGLKIPITAVAEKNFYTVPIEYLTTVDNKKVFLVETYDEVTKTTVTKEIQPKIYQSNENYYYVDPSDFAAGDTLLKPDSEERYKLGITAPIKGVYNVNQGYTIFRQIEIISQNQEYYIVKENTSYGLSLYDHIILNSKTVKENQTIYQ